MKVSVEEVQGIQTFSSAFFEPFNLVIFLSDRLFPMRAVASLCMHHLLTPQVIPKDCSPLVFHSADTFNIQKAKIDKEDPQAWDRPGKITCF